MPCDVNRMASTWYISVTVMFLSAVDVCASITTVVIRLAAVMNDRLADRKCLMLSATLKQLTVLIVRRLAVWCNGQVA